MEGVGRVVYTALLSLGVRDKANFSKEDRPFLGIMHVISSSYLSWADASSLESAQGPESTAFGLYSLSRHRLIVRVLIPGFGARSERSLSNEDFIVVVCFVLFSLWLLAEHNHLCRAPPHRYPPYISFEALLMNFYHHSLLRFGTL